MVIGLGVESFIKQIICGIYRTNMCEDCLTVENAMNEFCSIPSFELSLCYASCVVVGILFIKLVKKNKTFVSTSSDSEIIELPKNSIYAYRPKYETNVITTKRQMVQCCKVNEIYCTKIYLLEMSINRQHQSRDPDFFYWYLNNLYELY